MSLSVGGLASGLDTDSIISQLLTVQKQPIVRLQQEEANYQVELTTYGNLKGSLNSLLSAMENFDTAGEMRSNTATSGNTDIFTASADENAVLGSYDVTVSQLAEAQKLTSTSFSSGEVVGEGTLHINVGSDSATDIDISDTDTIDNVAQKINDADVGVKAVTMFDGNDYFLTLNAEKTGTDNVITLTTTEVGTAQGTNTDNLGLSRLVFEAGTNENMTNTQAPTNAKFSIDGVSNIERDSNTIDDAIPGVTLTLNSAPAAPDNKATLSVTASASAITSKIDSFVSSYNNIQKFIQVGQAYNSDTGVAGILMGDSTTSGIRNSLENMVSNIVPGISSFSRLSDLGIALNSDGQLEVDSNTLNTALQNNFDDVIKFFTQSTESAKGFSVRMVDTLNGILDSNDGILTARTDGIQNSIDKLQDQVKQKQTRVDTWETRTRAQFNSLELILAKYQSTGDYLTQQITSLNNLNTAISKT